MDKKKIVQTFLDSGLLLSPKIIDNINEDNINTYLKTKNLIVEENPKKGNPKEEKPKGNKSEITVNFHNSKSKPKLTIQDFVKYYNEIYEHLRNTLLKKTNATSINKIMNAVSEVTVIGMIKEITQQGFILEDPTGEIEVITNQSLDVNAVIAVTGVVREKKLFKQEIIYPEIPLPKNIPKFEGNLLLTTGEAKENYDVIFTTTGIKGHKIKSNPTWAEIEKRDKKITVLIYTPDSPIEEMDIIKHLQKRLLPSKSITPNKNILIETIPDIFWLIQDKEWTKNYKGITIISTDKTAAINLNTRECKFI